MASTVDLIKKQTVHYQTYQSNTCGLFTGNVSCPNGDWGYAKHKCDFGDDQLECSKIDPSTCPLIASGVSSYKWNSQGNLTTFPTVTCTYDVNKFTKTSDVQGWIANGGDPTVLNSVILPSFCALPSTKCAVGETSCTNLQATDEAGTLCKAWKSGSSTTNPNANVPTWWSLNGWWVLIVIFVSIFLILIIIVVIYSKNKAKPIVTK